jgi:hypothetical protein
MDDPNKTQSFIIRIWRESPRLWRGTIRHVQSDAQRGVTRLDQVSHFLEQHVDLSAPSVPAHDSKPVERLNLGTGFFPRRRLVSLWGLALAMFVLVLILVLAMPDMDLPLYGSTTSNSMILQVLIAFLSGMVTSAILFGMWFKFFRR